MHFRGRNSAEVHPVTSWHPDHYEPCKSSFWPPNIINKLWYKRFARSDSICAGGKLRTYEVLSSISDRYRIQVYQASSYTRYIILYLVLWYYEIGKWNLWFHEQVPFADRSHCRPSVEHLRKRKISPVKETSEEIPQIVAFPPAQWRI